MIELNDEILNKFIDEELDNEAMHEIKERLNASPADMIKYRRLLLIHEELKQLPVEEVSPNFTANLMVRVQRSLKSKKEQNFFVVSVLSLFLFVSLLIIGYIGANYIFTPGSNSPDLIIQFDEQSQNFISFLRGFFSKGNISIIGSVFSFLLLISGYFFFESIRHSKQP